jgi:hypothetical protein
MSEKNNQGFRAKEQMDILKKLMQEEWYDMYTHYGGNFSIGCDMLVESLKDKFPTLTKKQLEATLGDNMECCVSAS